MMNKDYRITNFLKKKICACVCMCTYPVFPSYYVNSGDGTQVGMVGGKHP